MPYNVYNDHIPSWSLSPMLQLVYKIMVECRIVVVHPMNELICRLQEYIKGLIELLTLVQIKNHYWIVYSLILIQTPDLLALYTCFLQTIISLSIPTATMNPNPPPPWPCNCHHHLTSTSSWSSRITQSLTLTLLFYSLIFFTVFITRVVITLKSMIINVKSSSLVTP